MFIDFVSGGKAFIHNRFLYKLKSSKDDYSWWSCKHENCSAKITLKDNDVVVVKGLHQHDNDDYEIQALQIFQEIKKRTVEEIATPIPTIYKEETSKNFIPLEVFRFLPPYNRVKSGLYKHRSTVLPPLPKSVDDLKIEGPWGKTIDGREFLLSDTGSGAHRIIIFGTSESIKVLSNVQEIFIDGTFKIVPEMFYQLYTIHGKYKGQMFPQVFVLLQGKAQSIYENMWAEILNIMHLQGVQPQFVSATCDFEASAINALKTTFPHVSVKACFFHYTQSIWRKVQALGISGEYRRNPAVKKWIKKISTLPLVPPPYLNDAIEIIKQEGPQNDKGNEMHVYLQNTYLGNGSTFPVALWNHFHNEKERTTNHVESWHSKINRKAKCNHPNIFRFISIIKNEEREIETTKRMLDAGHPPPQSNIKHIKKNDRLQKLKLKLINHQITLEQYMESLTAFSSLKS